MNHCISEHSSAPFLSSGEAGLDGRAVFTRALDVRTETNVLASQREAYAAGTTLEIAIHQSGAEAARRHFAATETPSALDPVPFIIDESSRSRSPNVKD